jgi:hypothetical protein
MSPADSLAGFVYGEHLDGASQRSLGFRLLAPKEPAPWSAEVESLARMLQAGPYPEYWPSADLFCSVLLATGQRLVAVARFGLEDHTPSRRRGGLELIGVVCPASLDPVSALKICAWLRQRKSSATDIHQLIVGHTLTDVLAGAPPVGEDPAPALPVRAWRAGVLLFAASSPQAPDRALGLLTQAPAGWQWLALCPPSFPLDEYARRGPLVAWTAEPIEVAVKLPLSAPTSAHAPATGRRLVAVLGGLLLVLLAANFWALWTLPSRIDIPRPDVGVHKEKDPGTAVQPPVRVDAKEGRENLALALYVLLEQEGATELTQAQPALVDRYKRLAGRDEKVRVSDPKGQAALGLISLLAGRSAKRVAQTIDEEFRDKKGYDPEFIRLICQRVSERLAAEASKGVP